MTLFVLAVFALAYLGMALGRLPGLALDRSGIAIVAAIALVAGGALPESRVAGAIHFPTLILLFSLMILSARFAAAGFYDAAAAWIARAAGGPTRLLALTVAVGGALSAVLVNDVVVFVMTPLLVRGLAARGLDPRPFLAGLAGAANAGSAATLIGNPQNIVIGQVGGLDFWSFAAVCAPPALAALAVVFVAVRLAWARVLAAPVRGTLGVSNNHPAPSLDRPQTLRAVGATLALLALFATPVPRELAALAVAGLLLTSRRYATRDMLSSVDWPLLLLFTGLFVVNAALAETGKPAAALAWLAERGVVPDRLAVVAPLMLVLSNTIGNVPAVVMLLGVAPGMPAGALHALALASTLAGNLLLVGSIANLIVAERAASAGARFGFADQARAGIPMTLASMAIAGAWLVAGGWVAW
jgi:Na+/H+ antiporter NhaD/arsenite permease-like protein